MEHEMRLAPAPFGMMLRGEKTIELRLYDGKRRRIRTGDRIRFVNTETGAALTARAAALHIFPSFEALYRGLPLKKCGYTEENAASASPADMEAYYSAEDIAKYGAVGIKLTDVREENTPFLYPFFRSIAEQDGSPVVICGLDHTIIYMNPAAAEAEAKHGGYALVGRSLLDCHSPASREKILAVVRRFAEDPNANRVHTFHNEKLNKDVYMIALRDEMGKLIGYYEKHEFRDRETAAPYSWE